MADTDIDVKFGAAIDGLIAGIAQATQHIESLTAPVRALTDHFKELSEAALAALGIEKFIDSMAELGEKTERAATILGVTTEQVGEFNAIAKLTGTSSDGMAIALERMQLNLQRAQSGATPAARALETLNLSAKDLIGLPIPQQLDLLADRLSRFADGGNKTAVVMALMGRSGAQMIPVFDQGSKGLEELAAMAERTGTAMDEATTKSFVDMKHAGVELGLSLEGLGITIMQSLAPAITSIEHSISDLIEWFNRSLKDGGTFKGLLDLIGVAAKGVAIAIESIVFAIEGLVQIADLAMREIRDAIVGNLGSAMKDIESFNASMEKSMKEFFTRLREIINSGEGGASGSAKPQLPAMGDATAGAGAMKQVDAEIKVLQQGLAQKKLIYDAEAAQFGITQNQKFALLQAAVTQEASEEEKLLQAELRVGSLSVIQRQDIENKIKELKAKTNTELVRLDEQSIAEQQKIWTGYLDTVSGAFNSQLKGLLTGMTSWSSALKNILLDLTVKFIEMVEKMGVEWAATEVAKTLATTTGAAARASAEEASAGATMASKFAETMASIGADVAKTFAGIVGFLSDSLGPAAVPVAIGVAGGVSVAAISMIPKLDVGTDRVLSSGLAMIHEGEQITPAETSGPYSGSGGSPVTFQIQAIDGASFQTWLNGGGGQQIVKFVQQAMLRNPSMRPAY
jgi:hypothetical protein